MKSRSTEAGSSGSVVSVIVAAGAGTRLLGETPKGLRILAGVPLYAHALRAFDAAPAIDAHILVVPPGAAARLGAEAQAHAKKPVTVVEGGARRQDSVLRGLEAALAPDRTDSARSVAFAAVHDAARPFVTPDLIERTIAAARVSGAAIPVLEVSDTVRSVDSASGSVQLLDRRTLRLAQTPQVGRLDWLIAAYQEAGRDGVDPTDEGAALERTGHRFTLVEGAATNSKITVPEDLAVGEMRLARAGTQGGPAAERRVGIGEDRHPISENRPFVLAGIELATSGGPLGHSDGDPLSHALVDALLGAAGMGTIGEMFPDDDPAWANAAGDSLITAAAARLREQGWEAVNVDCVLIVDSPRIAPHAEAVRASIARSLGVPPERVSVKGKRSEGLGFEGSGAGISCRAIALIVREPRA